MALAIKMQISKCVPVYLEIDARPETVQVKWPNGGFMPRSPIKRNARMLAARTEPDPRKFLYILKQLYDVLNDGETITTNSSNRQTKHARKAAQSQRSPSRGQ